MYVDAEDRRQRQRCIRDSSRRMDYAPENAEAVTSVEALLRTAGEDAFVIGGESVYRALLEDCDTAYVTKIDSAWPADAFFPDLDADPAWEIAEVEPPLEYEGLSFRYVTYRRVK